MLGHPKLHKQPRLYVPSKVRWLVFDCCIHERVVGGQDNV